MSLTNEAVLSRAAAAISVIEKMSQRELLATPTPDFLAEYNRTRSAFVASNPALSEAAPPEVLDQCRYVELLTYYTQLQGLLRSLWLQTRRSA
jgi:hypothetical protein